MAILFFRLGWGRTGFGEEHGCHFGPGDRLPRIPGTSLWAAADDRHSVRPCAFGRGEKFVLASLTEGLVNQRMGFTAYLMLASALNRTLILGPMRTGNEILGGQADVPFSLLYDARILAEHVQALGVAGARHDTPLGLGAVRVCAADAIPAAAAARTSRCYGIERPPFRPPEEVPKYSIRRFGGLEDEVLFLGKRVWTDLHVFHLWDAGARRFLELDAGLVLAESLRAQVRSIRGQMAEEGGRRVVWLHLRVESDWEHATQKWKGSHCLFNDAWSVLHKIEASLRSRSATDATECGESSLPRSEDVLYVAGGVKPAAVMARFAEIFARVYTLQDFAIPPVPGVESSHAELNTANAALDFGVGVQSDLVIGARCSTFSEEVVQLRNAGAGEAPTWAWTYSSKPFEQGGRLEAFRCDAKAAYGFDAWAENPRLRHAPG